MRKIAIGLAVVAALATTAIAPAEARNGHNAAIGLGIAAGVAGAAITAGNSGYYGPGPYGYYDSGPAYGYYDNGPYGYESGPYGYEGARYYRSRREFPNER